MFSNNLRRAQLCCLHACTWPLMEKHSLYLPHWQWTKTRLQHWGECQGQGQGPTQQTGWRLCGYRKTKICSAQPRNSAGIDTAVSETVLSFIQLCPIQLSALFRTAPSSMNCELFRTAPSWTQCCSRTAPSWTQCCPGQHQADLSAVPDSTKLNSVLFWTAPSWSQCCPGQHQAGLSAIPDSTKLNSALSRTAPSWTQRCPRQSGINAKLKYFCKLDHFNCVCLEGV